MDAVRNSGDRRIGRTRQVLKEGFIAVMREKGFASVSVKDIADRANVNRGTFYIHYPDKYILLEEIVRERFLQQLRASLPPNPGWNRDTLSSVIRSVLQCFEKKYRHRPPSSRFPALQVETVIMRELAGFLEQLIPAGPEPDADGENGRRHKIRIISRLICGEAVWWSQTPGAIPPDRETEWILSVIAGEMRFAEGGSHPQDKNGITSG